MFPKGWWDYKCEFRPLIVLVWTVIPATMVSLCLIIFTPPWGWTNELVWDKDTAPSWVQGLGSLVGLAIAIAVPWALHQAERKTRAKEASMVKIRIPIEMKELYEELAFHSARTFLREDWKDRAYYEARARLLIERLGQVRASASGFGAWDLLVNSEKSLSDLAALLRLESDITAKVQEFAQQELKCWMDHAFDALPGTAKQTP